jgi:hypothetical protein
MIAEAVTPAETPAEAVFIAVGDAGIEARRLALDAMDSLASRLGAALAEEKLDSEGTSPDGVARLDRDILSVARPDGIACDDGTMLSEENAVGRVLPLPRNDSDANVEADAMPLTACDSDAACEKREEGDAAAESLGFDEGNDDGEARGDDDMGRDGE